MRAAYMADLRAMRTENLDRPIKAFCARLFPPPGLDRLHCPVLLTFGEKEPRVMQGSMRDLERIITGSRVAVISGGKHNYPWANHAAYNEILGAWLKEHSAV
jgi:pimeloyl-ACP methyl ester carboxylesterase